ncbi:hypothetical protein [Paraburkholderia caffeinilytica]|uniref:hypothetical protein n=1 Tax=Paraburkholderia caffeinilytica TaxID=1761016 RepID=UPI003DA075F2
MPSIKGLNSVADVAGAVIENFSKKEGTSRTPGAPTSSPSGHSMGVLNGLASNNPFASTNPFRNGISSRMRAALPTMTDGGGMARNVLDTAASVASHLPGPMGAIGTVAQAGLNKIESSKTDTLGAVGDALGQGPAPSSTTASGDMDQAAMLKQATDAQQKNAVMTMKMSQLSQEAEQTSTMASFLTTLNKNMCKALTGQ